MYIVAKLFICMISSLAFDLGVDKGGGGGWNFEILRDEVDHKN